jgi:hypothetical protein
MPKLQQTRGYRVYIPYTIMEHLEPSTKLEPCSPLMPNPKPKTLGIIITHHNHLKIKKSSQTCLHPIESKLVMTNLTITKQVKLKTYGKHISSNRTEKLTISWRVYQSPSCQTLIPPSLPTESGTISWSPESPKPSCSTANCILQCYHPFAQGSKLCELTAGWLQDANSR